jgi:hypothetical protein
MNRRGWNLRGPAKPLLFGPDHPQWKGDAALTTTKRMRAQRAYPLTDCDECGDPATDRHHIDGDTGNNAPENIARLCRRCHMRVDGRLAQLAAFGRARKPQPSKPCSNCARPYKPLRRGRCAACAQYLRINGIERPRERWERAA